MHDFDSGSLGDLTWITADTFDQMSASPVTQPVKHGNEHPDARGAATRGMLPTGHGIQPERPDSSTRTSCSETYGRQWCAYCGARVHPNLTYRGAGCISSRLPSPVVVEGHVPAPSHGLHNGTTQPARVRGGSTGLKVEDNSQVCAN